ncbi:MAG: rRNA pseudouridine synthase [Oscillospiraceae bacterium]|nr:rRNA pseudouridine synthase [Oscillospiraceae bacterium]
MEERLQKLISAAHVASRRASETLITEGRVTVNGLRAALGQKADPDRDEICVDGVPLRFSESHTYLLLNKPQGYITTLRDEHGRPTVAELVRDAGVRVYPVGRLDYDSDGLLLLTDDGALAQALCHPSHEVDKTYRTVVRGDVARALPLLRGPMELDGRRLRPALVERVGEDTLEITVHEGRNRQVRRMCALAGLRVLRLTRLAEGPLHLGDLAPGKWRRLSAEEENELKIVTSAGSMQKN